MTGYQAGHPALRHRAAQALAELLTARSARWIGRGIGITDTTVADRGPRLEKWPLDGLMALCQLQDDHDDEGEPLPGGMQTLRQAKALREALMLFFTGEQTKSPQGSAARVLSDLRQVIGQAGLTIHHAIEAQQDGRLDPREKKQLSDDLDALTEKIKALRLNLSVMP